MTSFSTLVQILLATLMGGLLSVVAATLVMVGMPQRWMPRLVGFATGVLLAVALLDVLPEAFEAGIQPHKLFGTLLISLLAFLHARTRGGVGGDCLHPDEQGHDHHCPPHEHDHGHHEHSHGIGRHAVIAVVIGDTFHNFVDGVLLAATFLTSPVLGWSTAFAVIAHEIPHEAGAFAIVRAGGYSAMRSLLLNGFSSLASVLGGTLGFFALSHAKNWLPYILVVAAASFLYIAISDLLPMLRREGHLRTSMWQTGLMLVGIALIAIGTASAH